MPKFNLSIVTRLVLLVIAVGLPLSAILAWSLYSQYRGDVAVVEYQAIAITGAIAARTEITLDQTRSILMGIASRPDVQAMDRRDCDPFLAELHNTLPRFANFNVLNRQWEFVCSAVNSDPNVITPTKYPEVYERMMAADDIALSPPIQGQLTHKWVVFAAYPVKNADNKLLGAVTAPMDLTALAPAISDDTLPANTIIRIMDSNGLVVTSYPDTGRIGQYDPDTAMLARNGQSDSSFAPGSDGRERVYAYTRVKGTDWVAVAGLPTEWAFANFRFVRNQLLFALLVVLALAATLAFLVARQIVGPIRMLQQDAEALASGRHEHRSQVVGDDEIGQLGATFNNLSAALESEEKERRRADGNLRQLNRVYAMLSQINALIVRVKDLDELFAEACRIAADAGGFRISMLVTVDRGSGQAGSIVSAGADEDLLTAIKELLVSPEGMQKSVLPAAINDKKPVISNDVQNDSRLLFGQMYAAAGVNSMVVLPLLVADDVVGVLALYASEIDFFQHDEMQLLTELAGDIAFAIDHIEKQDRLNYLAYYDELTGLANRSLLLERLAQYMDRANSDAYQLAIGLIDLERFKNINDSFGRPAGDALLNQVAAWLTNRYADSSILARINADEFAIILPRIRSDGNLGKLIENFIDAFREHPFQLENKSFRIGIKLGIAVFPEDGADADSLLKNAEAALKNAKKSGDRYLFHTRKMTEAVAGKLALENRLRDALKHEEFVLHYQPKVGIASGKVAGAEALIRWNDPLTGLVPPGTFIPLLEETGLINDVGRWALNKAIEDYLRWHDAGLDSVPIAVNVSPLQLQNRNFYNEIEQAIAIDSRVAAGLELEITESLIMSNVEKNIMTLRSIRALGIPIAIDDFGTGFSSLSYLSRLPLDTLKIDRSFVVEMNTPEGLELVSTITRVAHALKLKVVAEGVETEEQLHQLGTLDCDEVQGFLFSKPVPADDFVKLFLTPS